MNTGVIIGILFGLSAVVLFGTLFGYVEFQSLEQQERERIMDKYEAQIIAERLELWGEPLSVEEKLEREIKEYRAWRTQMCREYIIGDTDRLVRCLEKIEDDIWYMGNGLEPPRDTSFCDGLPSGYGYCP